MISVVLAAYKGEKYIGAQVESIISQLGENDELIVSDDFPTGDTRKAIADLIENDKRIIYSFRIRMMFGLTVKSIPF